MATQPDFRSDVDIVIPEGKTNSSRPPVVIKFDQELERKTGKRFAQALHHKMQLYRMDALDALRELAVMPMTENAMLMQVKYQAAARLAGTDASGGVLGPPSEIDQTLKRLNDDYRSAAPRIKSVRERVIEYEEPPKLIRPED